MQLFLWYAIYLVDVKGYSGHLSTDQILGYLMEDELIILAKANSHARVYVTIRATLLKEEHAPWCQGVAFVTGNEGSGITLQKSQENLSIFDPSSIIEGLVNRITAQLTINMKSHPRSAKKPLVSLAISDKCLRKIQMGPILRKLKP